MTVKSESEVTQLCLTPGDPMDWSLRDSSVYGIFQAGVLEWVAIAFSDPYLVIIIINQDPYLVIIITMVNLHLWASFIAQLVKNLLAMQETQVRFLGWEDPLEKGRATHCNVLAWEISWTEECVRL